MKHFKTLLLGFLALGIIATTSCTKGDDEGPTSDPTPQGTLTGKYFKEGAMAQVDWEAQSVTADFDTLSKHVRITATDAAGDVITILLGDTAEKYYTLFQYTYAESTYLEFGDDTAATTRHNDPSLTDESTIQITDNGMNDGILKGNILSISWFKVYEGIDNDIKFAQLFQSSFEVPLSTKGAPAVENTLTASIDGELFDPESLTKFGNTLIGSNPTTGTSITITVPTNLSLGEHELTNTSSGYGLTYSESSTVFTDVVGTLTITEFDSFWGSASGTFEATVTPMGGGTPVEITNGSFSF